MSRKELTQQELRRRNPNLKNYDKEYASFRWDQIWNELSKNATRDNLNIAYEAIDCHADGIQEKKIPLHWIGKEGNSQQLTYLDLKEQTNRFANVLQNLGIKKGDVICTLTGRIPALYITALGTVKNGSVYCPLFSIYGPEPIYQRLSKGKAKILVTTKALFDKKVSALQDRLENLHYVLLTDVTDHESEKVRSFQRLMMEASSDFVIAETSPEDPALLHFTSGTTGMPKGVIHVHQAALTHFITGKYVLDFHPDDIFWCTADPGWVTGTSYGILSPLMHGITNLVVEAEFDARLWYQMLEQQKVTIWYTAPTAIRRLMRMNIDVRKEYDLSALRLIHSVGEPLNPEAVRWAEKILGMPILDNWWQTETGGIMIANYPSMPVKPGSMGKPLPGVEAEILDYDENGDNVKLAETGEAGHLALKKGWPSMFQGYLDEEERYQQCFVGDWYLTGDLASRDEDGYFWFVGRADDIIKTAGHMVGPFEVESILMEQETVAEAAVIGKPDPVMGELVKAFITLKERFEPSEELNLELKGFARERLGSAVAPKEIEFIDELPKTRSGKIMRRLLRDQEREKIEKISP
jgi:acetyl-CoA synthetase